MRNPWEKGTKVSCGITKVVSALKSQGLGGKVLRDVMCHSTKSTTDQPDSCADSETPEDGSMNPTTGVPTVMRAPAVENAALLAKACTLAKTKLSAVSAGESPNLQGNIARICSCVGDRNNPYQTFGGEKERVKYFQKFGSRGIEIPLLGYG